MWGFPFSLGSGYRHLGVTVKLVERQLIEMLLSESVDTQSLKIAIYEIHLTTIAVRRTTLSMG